MVYICLVIVKNRNRSQQFVVAVVRTKKYMSEKTLCFPCFSIIGYRTYIQLLCQSKCMKTSKAKFVCESVIRTLF